MLSGHIHHAIISIDSYIIQTAAHASAIIKMHLQLQALSPLLLYTYPTSLQ